MKYCIILTRSFHGTEYVVKKLNFNSLPGSVQSGKKSYIVNYGLPLVIWRGVAFYVLNADSGTQKVPNETSIAIKPADLDAIIGTKIIREITSAVSSNPMEKILRGLVWFIIGLLSGLLIGFLVMQGKIDAIPAPVLNSTQIGIGMI